MFQKININILDRMSYLEKLDTSDRTDGTSRLDRLRQIPAETGKFLALMAAMAPDGTIVEIGTSAGYSTLWLSLSCHDNNRKIRTFEIMEDKIKLARETFHLAGVEDVIELIEGDAKKLLGEVKKITFCFLDAEKEDYISYYDIILPKMVSGGILIADNVISHQEALEPFVKMAQNDCRVDALVVPIGKGELVCKKL